MSFIPGGNNWYLALMLFSTEVKAAGALELEVSFTLIYAAGPEEAYNAAMKIGHEREVSFTNTDDQVVDVKYHGLKDLNVILDPLENGAEIAFEVIPDIESDEIAKQVSRKEDLGVFKPTIFDRPGSR